MTRRTSAKFFGDSTGIVSACPQKMLQTGEAQALSIDDATRQEQLPQVDIIFSGAELSDPKCATLTLGAIDHPRDRAATWIQFIGLFFNMEKIANQYAVRISDAYDCQKLNAQSLTAVDTVAWIDYEVTGSGDTLEESWKVSNAGSDLSYITDAGEGTFLFLNYFFLFFSSSFLMIFVYSL